MIENRGFSGTQILVAFLGGAVAGAVTALLTAPRSGKETRERIGEAVRTAGEKTTLVVGGAYDRAARAMKAARQELASTPGGDESHVGH
ncbi:MAG TPA: YtxH domain-containing protein [Candidatus Polarisedimenticolaceae bacterium]